MPSPILRMSIPLLIGMNKVLIVFQDEHELPLWKWTDSITTFRESIIHCCYLDIGIIYIQKFSRKDFTHGRQVRNIADQIISIQNIPIGWPNSWLRNNTVLKTWLVFQKSSWEWHLYSEIFLKWNLAVLSSGQLGDNIINYLPFDLPMRSEKAFFNLTTWGNAKPPASKDGSSKRTELPNASNSPLLEDKRIISTQALALS